MAPISGLQLKNGHKILLAFAAVFALGLACLALFAQSTGRISPVALFSGPAIPLQIDPSYVEQKPDFQVVAPKIMKHEMVKYKHKLVKLDEGDEVKEEEAPPHWHMRWYFFAPQSNPYHVPHWFEGAQPNAESDLEGPISFPDDGSWFSLGIPDFPHDHFGTIAETIICVKLPGRYTFTLESDDGSNLWLDGPQLVWDDGLHGMRRASGTRHLAAGIHTVKVNFYENWGGAGLVVTYSGPDTGGAEQPLLPTNHAECDAALAVDPEAPPTFSSSYWFHGYWPNRPAPWKTPNYASQAPDITLPTDKIDFPDDAAFAAVYGGMPGDHFSALYQGKFCIVLGGIYVFKITSDDGSHLWIDGKYLLNDGGLHGPQEVTGEMYLAPGVHNLKADFYENDGGAMLTLKYAGTDTIGEDMDIIPTDDETCALLRLPKDPPPPPSFHAHWFFYDYTAYSTKTINWNAYPNIETNQETMEFASAADFAGDYGAFFPADNYAMIADGHFFLENAGTYDFILECADGCVMIVDRTQIVDNDGIHETQEKFSSKYMYAGLHTLKIKYFHGSTTSDAALMVKYAGSDTNGVAEPIKPAYSNASLYETAVESTTGILMKVYYHPFQLHAIPDHQAEGRKPKFEKVIEGIDFHSAADFSGGYEGFPQRGWSAVFTAKFCILKHGTYKFISESSDGSKIWVDGRRIVDNGGEHPMEEESRSMYLKEGFHSFEAKYFMNGDSEGEPGFSVKYSGEDTGDADVVLAAADECDPPPQDYDEEGDTGAATPEAAHLYDATGKSLLNIHCANIESILKGENTGYGEFWQKREMADCMVQDCEMSFETQQGIYSGCRFTDKFGMCYAYNSAQQYCAEHMEDQENCFDNAGEAALPPLGTWDGEPWETEWHPIENAELKIPGDPLDGTTYSCTCMKNCGCVGEKDCWCEKEDQEPVGYDEGAYEETHIYHKPDNRGKCSCSCGGVYSGV